MKNDTEKSVREKYIKTMDDIDEIVEQIEMYRNSEKDAMLEMSADIVILCKILRNHIPAIDLLRTKLENGGYMERDSGEWTLFEAGGEIVATGESLKQILVELVEEG